MSTKYSIPEILTIHNYENILFSNPNIPEQLMYNIYNDIQEERVRLHKRLKLMAKKNIISDDTKNDLILEEQKEFIQFLCRLIKRYKIHESNMSRFIADVLNTFDYLDSDLTNLSLKKEILDFMLQNHKLNPEQISLIALEKRYTEDDIIEMKNPHIVTA